MSDKDVEDAGVRSSGKGAKLRGGSRRASAATSTISNRSDGSSKTSKPGAGPPTPESPQVRITRKRAAETANETGEAERTQAEHGSPTHTRGSSGDSRDSAKSVCLCQPDPKIPRPRNAFILYRQHHQAAVAVQNPGLANPDISKIIGEQWRSQPASVKNEWKQLAEEEKLRHQQQYPEYRYRPRRNDRRSSISDPSNNKDPSAAKNRCSKCGGRSITTTSAAEGSNVSSSAMQNHVSNKPPSTPVGRYLPMMNKLSLVSPQQSRRPRVVGPGMHINVAGTRQRLPEEHESPISPEAKRRRYNGPQHPYVLSHAPGPPGTPYFIPSSYNPIGVGHARRESLPPPADLFRMSPPHTASSVGPSMRNAGWERINLTLPPLKNTPVASGPESRVLPALPAADNPSLRERRSVEAMVTSMSFLGKLKILRKIAPPLDASPANLPSTGTRTRSQRGVIVAMEGMNRSAVSELITWLEPYLSKGNEHDVKVWEGPRVPESPKKASIKEFLEVVHDWHRRSDEMESFVRSAPPPEAVPAEDLPAKNSTSGDTVRVAAHGTSQDDPPATNSQRPEAASKIPVMLLNTYTLHACDRYACSIPISDAYSPADHWQWMATLWRGIPGPDVTIYVKEVDTSTAAADSPERNGNAPNNATPRPATDKDKIGTVEITDEGGVKCLLVWKEKDKPVEGGALRRLGFELGEWIRGFGSSQG